MDDDAADDRLEVWFTPDRLRYYLVPRGIPLPGGEDVIRGPLPLRRRRVELEAMTAWEVPKAEALAEIDRRVGAAAGEVRGFLGRMVDAGRQAAGTPGKPGVDEVPDLDPRAVVGVSAGELVSDPEAPRKAVSGLLDRAADAAERIGAVADGEQKERLKDRLHGVEHDLLDPDGAVPSKLRELEDDVREAIPKLGQGLDRLARSIKAAVTDRTKVDPDEPET